MFKFLSLLTLLFSVSFADFQPRADYTLKKFTCDSTFTVEHNIYNSKVSYDNDNKVIQYTYTNPVSLIEYYDYNTLNKYHFEGSNCDTEIILGDFPAFYILDTDIFVKTEKISGINVDFYYRENSNIKNFTIKQNHINTIIYQDDTVQTFKNCEAKTSSIKDTSKCSKPFCPTISDIVFVVDESSNLTEDEFNKVKTLMVEMLDNYDISEETTNVGIVSFAETARIISYLSGKKEDLINTINNMGQYGGGTCLSCGFDKAYEVLMTESDYRKILNIDRTVITFISGDINKPVINNANKKHSDCYSLGNCKNSCDKTEFNTVECSSVCPNERTNYCYNNTCFKYNNNENTWYLDVIDNKCIINNTEFRNNCCINGPDACCCEAVKVINGCDFGDYDETALENSVNILKNNKVNVISVGIRFNNKTQLESFSTYSYTFNSINELENLNKNITRNSCNFVNFSMCGPYCNGLCGYDKACYCPECEDTGDYCEIYECKSILGKVEGCKAKSIECTVGEDKCRSVSKDPTFEGCCKYVNNSCDDGNLCKNNFCYPDGGCYSTDIVCDDYDPCTINSCNPKKGCGYKYNEDKCSSDQVCKKLTSTEHKCYPSLCSKDSDCNVQDSCGEAKCENNECIYYPLCISSNPCLILESCDKYKQKTDPNKCVFKNRTCTSPNSCYTNGRCVPLDDTNWECQYDETQCEQPESLCQYSYCHPSEGCKVADIKCDNNDPCKIPLGCVEHTEWNNYTCEYLPKCEHQTCKDTYCTETGDCIYTDIKCSIINPCFVYECENDECIPKIPEKEAVDPCGKCLEEYHKLGQYIDLTNSSCKGKIVNNSDVPFNIISESSISSISSSVPISKASIQSSYLYLIIISVFIVLF